MIKEYELVPHTADLKIHAYGITFQELFKNALKGMFSSIKPQSPSIEYKEDMPVVSHFTTQHPITIHANDRETLLIDFLSECLYLSDIHNEAYFDARFTLMSETELQGIIYGVKIEGFEVVEIKAVTYHDIAFEQNDGIWRATIVFDI